MNYPVAHGIQLANNSEIRNLVVERLNADPVLTEAGRLFYNPIDKRAKFTHLDVNDAVILGSIAFMSDVSALLINLQASGAGKGANIVGYGGKVGLNAKFSVAATTVEAGMDLIVAAIDAEMKATADHTALILSANGAGEVGTAAEFVGTSVTLVGGTVEAFMTALPAQFDALDAIHDQMSADLATNFLNKTSVTPQVVVADTTFQNSLIIQGDLTVSGATVQVTSETVTIADNILQLNSNFVTGIPTENAGLQVLRGDNGTLDFIVWDESLEAVTIPVWDGVSAFVQKRVADFDYVQTEAVDKINLLLADLASAAVGKGAELVAYAGATQGATTVTAGNVDSALDQIVVLLEATKSSGTTITTDLQTELDTTQESLGLGLEGELPSFAATTYLATATNYAEALTTLDVEIKANEDDIADEQIRAAAVEGSLAALATSTKADLVSAINEVHSDVDAEAARAIARENSIETAYEAEVVRLEGAITNNSNAGTTADALLRANINAQRHTYLAPVAATTHTIVHNLGSAFVDFTVLVEGADLVYRNDIVLVEETDTNTLTVKMTEARKIKVAVTAVADI
jgi:hypothetical protein